MPDRTDEFAPVALSAASSKAFCSLCGRTNRDNRYSGQGNEYRPHVAIPKIDLEDHNFGP
jgi:hypothetical protein